MAPHSLGSWRRSLGSLRRGSRLVLALALALLVDQARAQTPSTTATETPSETPTSTPLPFCFDVGNPASPNFERYLYGASGRYNATIIPEGSAGANYWRSPFPQSDYCTNNAFVEFNDAGSRPQY